MKKLSNQSYRDDIHEHKSKKSVKIPWLFWWLQNYEFYKICAKYIVKKYNNIFEVWCAPWNFLIKFHNLFWLKLHGIEYSQEWIKTINENFKNNNIKANIINWDFFNKKFLKDNKDKYDIVYSLWFIEHFSNPEEVIKNHFEITKKWWLVIISIPNLKYINRFFVPKNILDIHNLKIMDIRTLKNLFKKYHIIEAKYIWWLCNIWLFTYKNYCIEKIRFLLFLIQRLLFDPIFILLYKLGINFSNKYSSPQIIIICKK